jgi:hypothetical protein
VSARTKAERLNEKADEVLDLLKLIIVHDGTRPIFCKCRSCIWCQAAKVIKWIDEGEDDGAYWDRHGFR